MEWTEDHDLCLSQEILSLEPFKAKKGSIVRRNILTSWKFQGLEFQSVQWESGTHFSLKS